MIAVHIGLRKCASSTIQKFFVSNRETLLELSVDYPTIGISNNNHRNFYFELVGSDKFDPSYGTLTELMSYWRSAPSATMVLSAEIFERLDREEKIAKMRSCLANARPPEPIIVIMIIRSLSERMVSSYGQIVKYGRYHENFDAVFQAQMEGRVTCFDMASLWANVFGWDNLRVRPLAADQLVNGDIVDDFLSLLGVDITDQRLLQMKRHGRRNVTPGWRVLESIRALYDESGTVPPRHPILKAVKENGRRRTLGTLAVTAGEEMGWNADRGRYLTREQAEQCQAVYRGAIEKLNEKLTKPLPVPRDLDSTGFVEREFLPSAAHIARSDLLAFYDRLAEFWNKR